jgi:hypothetical protein
MKHIKSNKNQMYGKVVNNNDPEGLGRVQVRIPDIFEDTRDSDLPWAIPKRDALVGDVLFGVPSIDTLVTVEFQDDNSAFLIYDSVLLSSKNKIQQNSDPNLFGFWSAKNSVILNKTTGSIEIKSGSKSITITDNLDIIASNVKITCDSANIECSGVASITAATIKLNS